MIRVVTLVLALMAGSASGAEIVAEFKGSNDRVTAEFKVEAPWIMEWRITTDGDHDAAVDVSLESAPMGIHQGSVLKAKYPGNGVRLFNQGGRFQFRVNSLFANWTLRVEQLTPEEAAEYTPRDRSLLD